MQEAREAKGLSPAEFADAVGVSRAAVRMWENGQREPRTRYLQRIADVTERQLAWFYTEDGVAA